MHRGQVQALDTAGGLENLVAVVGEDLVQQQLETGVILNYQDRRSLVAWHGARPSRVPTACDRPLDLPVWEQV